METQKMGFFTKLKKSILNFEEYEKFIQEKTVNAFCYFFKLIAILSILVTLGLVYIHNLNPIICPIMFLVSFILYSIIILLDVFTLSILGIIINNIIRTNFKYKTILKISIYAMTLPIILCLLYIMANIFFRITIKYFQLAYRAIAYIYLTTVMLIIKADFIKNTQELQRVVEEQKKVKEELEREKEEEKEKQRQKEKEKQDEKKNREKGKEKTPQEPQPDNG